MWVQVLPHLRTNQYCKQKQVLEAGNNYHIVSVKGLELQETSCHSLEATRLVLSVVMGIHGHPSYYSFQGGRYVQCSI